jgi:hypothetical protein
MAGLYPDLSDAVAAIYDFQKQRIGLGNRIVGQFYRLSGIIEKPGDKIDEDEKDKILKGILKDYDRVTDHCVDKIPTQKKFQPEGRILHYGQVISIEAYKKLLGTEQHMMSRLTEYLTGIPIYEQFLKPIRGIGDVLSAVVLAKLNPYKAKYPSSFRRYSGTDECKVAYTFVPISEPDHVNELDKFIDEEEETDKESIEDKNGIVIDGQKMKLKAAANLSDENAVLAPEPGIDYENNPKYIIKNIARSKKVECQVYIEYTDKNGKLKKRKSITYDTFLKSKLLSTLASSLLRQKSPDYYPIYIAYKERYNNMPAHKGKSPKHIHNMASRAMVKRFLIDLHLKWRELEGLEVFDDYAVAKLGIIHTGTQPRNP